MSRLPDKSSPSVGEAMERAVLGITRWASRPDVRRRMLHDGSGDFSPTDTWLLARLVETGGMRMSALAEWQGIDRSTITAHIRRLEGRGLVIRAPDPSDRRAVLVRATVEAERTVARNSQAARALLAELVGEWTEHERSELTRLLGRFAAELEGGGSAEPGAAPCES